MEIFPVEIVCQNVWVNGKYIGAASGILMLPLLFPSQFH